MSQEELPYDVGLARRTDPDTSHEAAASVARGSGEWVLGVLSRGRCLSDEQIETFARAEGKAWTGQRLRTARSALVSAGLVEADPEKYGQTASGRRCRLWRAVAGA